MSEIKTGQQWQNRSGDKVTVFNINSGGDNYPVIVIDKNKKLTKLTKEGHFIGPSHPHGKDLTQRI